MKISTKTRYGVRAMLDLAEHSKDRRPVFVKDIAHRQNVSAKYLEQIMLSLKKAGLVSSIVGAKGGYFLMKKPQDITLLDIVSVLEGSLAPVVCIDNGDLCDRTDNCNVRTLWCRVQDAVTRVLGSKTLEDLLENG